MTIGQKKDATKFCSSLLPSSPFQEPTLIPSPYRWRLWNLVWSSHEAVMRRREGGRTRIAILLVLQFNCYNPFFFAAEGWNLNSPANKRGLTPFTGFQSERRGRHRSSNSPRHRAAPTKPPSSSCLYAAGHPRRSASGEVPDNPNDAKGNRPTIPSRSAPPSHAGGGGGATRTSRSTANKAGMVAAGDTVDAADVSDFDAVEEVALCIVPPDAVWDTLQRARHVAHDASASIWPPCLRLFHPLGIAKLDPLQVAAVVEQHHIAPFSIRLSQWAVVPHLEAMADTMGRNLDPNGATAHSVSSSSPREQESSSKGTIARTEIEALIDREERRGRINKARREERRRLKLQESGVEEYDPQSESTLPPPKLVTPARATPRNKLQEQQRMYEEFNGPCVVCLEPDDDSKAKLMELRELLRLELFNASDFVDAYSPTATAGPGRSNNVARTTTESTVSMDPTSYRPLVPIGAFPTVSEAIKMARKLRTLWSPLTFDVTDLQLVSLRRSSGGNDQSHQHQYPYRSGRDSSHNPPQVGCDAMVMLMGQEIHVDASESQDMALLVCEKGETGGADPNNRRQASSRTETPVAPKTTDRIANTSPIMHMLDDDEDDEIDEGTVVVIGRTHFFTGEMRLYVGMPATSTADLQGSNDSALSRRRGAIRHSRRQDGEFGQAMLDDDASDDLIAFLAENDGT